MIPYIGRMAVEKRTWIDEGTFRDGVALCQTIPGATAMQVSAYVGFRARGVVGAAVSFIGFGLPAFFLMAGLSAFYVRSHTLPPVAAVFHGLQAVVVAIVANATVTFGKSSLKNVRDGRIAAISAAIFGSKASPILVILLAALLGFVLYKNRPLPSLSSSSNQQANSTRPILIIMSVAAFCFVVLFLAERRLSDLAVIMFRVDLFAFGGGFASLLCSTKSLRPAPGWMGKHS